MKRLILFALLAVSILGGSSMALAQDYGDGAVEFVPPPDVSVTIPLPRPWRPVYRRCPRGSVFIPGQWSWNGASWDWLEGSCQLVQVGRVYVAPRYVTRRGVVIYRPGHWMPVPRRGYGYGPRGHHRYHR